MDDVDVVVFVFVVHLRAIVARVRERGSSATFAAAASRSLFEWKGRRSGSFVPIGGPIPLPTY